MKTGLCQAWENENLLPFWNYVPRSMNLICLIPLTITGYVDILDTDKLRRWMLPVQAPVCRHWYRGPFIPTHASPYHGERKYSEPSSKDHLLIKTTFYKSHEIYFPCSWTCVYIAPVYKDHIHIWLIPKVVFIYIYRYIISTINETLSAVLEFMERLCQCREYHWQLSLMTGLWFWDFV